jgi:catechol 2,3-dioxygenase-like lactoylglutathione lyase family enzyme
VPQSAFWTFGSTFTDTVAMYERLSKLDPKRFQFLPVYIGPDDNVGVHRSALGPYGDQILTLTQLRERAAREKAEGRTQIAGATSNQDFGYLVDPDGMLVEFNLGGRENFWGHHHYWHEQPLCASNWYAEHLGMQLPAVRDAATGQMTPRAPYSPCDVPIGEVSYPSFIRAGQLRIPLGSVRFANGTWTWYTRQCRFGRCGPGNDQPLARSRGQVVDHIGLSFPNLDPVIAHLKAKGVPILEGPYPFAGTRAVMIEDLDGLALELVEVK